METMPAPTVRLLLLKSGAGTGAKIAHQSGYALYGGRWHKITADAPAPKGAPVAAHPKSAGHHDPVAHFTDDQWAALKLPDSNVNAPVFNKALEKLKAWSDAGDVTAIVGAGFGTNTYGKKLASVANHLLGLHGSAHKVEPGQKPGTHAASQVAEPADPHPTGLPEHLAPRVDPLALPADIPTDSPWHEVADGAKKAFDKGDWEALADFASETNHVVSAMGKKAKAYVEGLVKAAQKKQGAKPGDGVSEATKTAIQDLVTAGEWQYLEDLYTGDEVKPSVVAYAKQVLANKPAPAASLATEKAQTAFKKYVDKLSSEGSWEELENLGEGGSDWAVAMVKEALAKKPAPAAPSGPLSMPAFEEGATTTGVKAHYEHIAQKVIDHGHAGNGSVLDGMKADGMKPNHKGKVSNTWAGKTANSKKLLALHAAALAHATGATADAEPFSVKSAKPGALPNEGTVHTLYASAFSGVEKALGLEPGDLSDTDSTTYTVTDHKGRTFSVYKHGGALSVRTSGKNTDAASAKELLAHLQDASIDTPKEGDTKPGANGSTLVLKDGHWVKQGGDQPAVVGLSPEEIPEIESYTGLGKKTVAEANAAALSGDVAGLKQLIADITQPGDETYKPLVHAKKLLALLEAKAGAPDAGNPAPSVTALSAKQLENLQAIPWFKLKLPAENTNAKSHNAAIAKIEGMAFSGDTAGLKAFIASKAGAKQTYAKKQALLAQTALAALGVEGATAAVPVEPAPVAQPTRAAANPYTLVNEWKTAIVAGRVPTKAQAQAFDALGDSDPDVQQAYFLDAVSASIPSSTSQLGDEFDAAYQAANEKVHQLHGHALAGTKPAAPVAPPAAAPTKKLTPAEKKLVQIDPAMVQKWLSAEKGKAGEFAGFFDFVGVANKNKFFKWVSAANSNAYTAPAKLRYTSNAICSLFGKHDHCLLSTGEFLSIDAAIPAGATVVTDVATIKDAVLSGKKPAAAAPAPVAAAPAAPPAPAAPVQVKSSVFQNTTDGHNKFWSASIHGSTLKTVYGKVGSKGQQTIKEYGSPSAAVAAYQKLIDEKKAKGYVYQGQGVHLHDAPAAAVEQGPKEGDTKRGADGMLVLKNGHWVKMDDGAGGWNFEASSAGLSGAPALFLSSSDDSGVYIAKTDEGDFEVGVMSSGSDDFDATHHKTIAAAVAAVAALGHKAPPASALQKLDPSYKSEPAKIKKLTLNEINEAIYKVTSSQAKFSSNSAAKMATAAAKKGDGDGMVAAYAKAIVMGFPKTASHIKAVAEAMGVNTAAWDGASAPAAATPAPAEPPVPGVESIDGWKKTGQQDGYNDGAFYTDGSGQQWYCKFSVGGEDVAKSEMLALKLYEAAGLATPTMKLVTKGGKVGTASKVIAGLKQDKALLQSGGAHAIYSGFAADAWLANWDTVGNNPAAGKGWDNIQFGPDGTAYRIDAGGALAYKGTGGKKTAAEWGKDVVELKTLLDSSVNANTAKAFGKMTPADVKASVAKVIGVSDYTIQALVDEFGPGGPAEKQALTLKLIARKKSIADQHPDVTKKTEAKGSAEKVKKEKPDPTNLKVDASLLPKMHDFMNWSGTGKPISDKPYVQQNIVDEQAILAFALKGNLVALKEYKFQPVDKMTGQPTGAPKPISEHPSAHVKSFYDSCVNFMEVLANPPEPLRTFNGTAVNTVAELSEHFSPFDYGKGVANVPANQRLGFWIALGSVADPHKFKPKVVGKAITAAKKAAAYENWQKLPKTVKTFLSAVQGSGSANQPYRDGKETDTSGQNCRQVLADCFAHASEHDEGFTVHKWMSMPDSMIQQFLQNPEGLVFQNPGSMCTSRSATGTSGFGEHRVTIHYAKGAKGMDTFGSGSFAGEQEITTIPGARFMVLKREMVPGKHGSSKRLELEVLMLPPDPGYIANLGKTPTV